MIVLDIGAGDTTFGKKLKRLNPRVKTVLCGEPGWKYKYNLESAYGLSEKIAYYISNIRADLLRVLSEAEIEEVLTGVKKGVYRITSKYEKIDLPDNSVDIVTLNSPHPMTYPRINFFNRELCRVLKPGGIFYFGSSTSISVPKEGEFASSFEVIGGGKFDFGKAVLDGQAAGLTFPVSPTILSNARVLFHRELDMKHGFTPSFHSGYLYNPGHIQLSPNWKAWLKK